MKKIFSIIFVALLLPMTAQAAKYTEGKQYTKISETATSKSVVREYFSFYCPHCVRFEPFMKDLAKSLPDGTSFEKNHVDFLGGSTKANQALLSKALVIAEQLAQKEALIATIFDAAQVKRIPLTNQAQVRTLFATKGVSGAEFDKLFKSFGVNSKLKKMQKNQQRLMAKKAITGVPTIFVNGKYRVNVSNLDKENFLDDYKELVLFLLTLK
jgi:thiol:disulfide interchange protein DsbA